MPEINITIKNKIAYPASAKAFIVRDNSDYVVNFEFDSEWDVYAEAAKTARFAFGGGYVDVPFTGNSVTVPIISNGREVNIGVFAGNLSSTTPASFLLLPSIRSKGGAPIEPESSVYDKIMALIKSGGVDPETITNAVETYLAEHPIVETDPTVPAWAKAATKPTYTASEVGALPDTTVIPSVDGMLKYTAQSLTDAQKQQARTNIGAGTSSFSGSYNDLTNKPTIPDVSGKVDKAQGTANSGKYLAVGADGNVTTVDAPSAAEQVQSDWEQNDSTKADYVKNRICYDSRTTTERSVSRDMTFTSAQMAQKIADVGEIDINGIKSITGRWESKNTDSGEITFEANFNIAEDAITIIDLSAQIGAESGTCYNIVAYDEQADIELTFMYFANDSVFALESAAEMAEMGITTTGLYCVGSDLFEGVEVNISLTIGHEAAVGELKTIDPKYINDMYYEEVGRVDAIGYTQSWEKSTSSGVYTWETPLPLEKGQHWFVATDYEDDVVKEDTDGTLYIGTAPSVAASSSSWSAPYSVTASQIKYIYGWWQGRQNKTLKCVANATIIHTINAKYFPENVVTTETLSNEVSSQFEENGVLFEWNFPVENAGNQSITHGYNNKATGKYAHAEGVATNATEYGTHAEGYGTTASTKFAHAEGYSSTASGENSHAEGYFAIASGNNSHAEGFYAKASGNGSHAEGRGSSSSYTIASGDGSHTEGESTEASGAYSHTEGGYSKASGVYSHAEGFGTIASARYQHTQGKYNIADTTGDGTYAHIVGNGTSDSARSNAYTLDWSGNGVYSGTVTATGVIVNSSTSGSTKKFKLTVDDSGTISATEVTE